MTFLRKLVILDKEMYVYKKHSLGRSEPDGGEILFYVATILKPFFFVKFAPNMSPLLRTMANDRMTIFRKKAQIYLNFIFYKYTRNMYSTQVF